MLVILIGRIVQILLMLATIKTATYLLIPAELGKVALMGAAVVCICMFLVNPVGMYVNRQIHSWNQHGLARYYLTYEFIYIAIIAVFSAGILGFVNTFILKTSIFPTSYIIVYLGLYIFFNTVHQTSIPLLNILGFRNSYSILSNISTLLSLLLGLLLVHYWGADAKNWMLGLLLGQILFAMVGSVFFLNRINKPKIRVMKQPNIADLKKVFSFAWPIALAVGLNWIQSQGYRFFIKHSFGLSTLGLFVAGYMISSGIFMAFESLFTAYFQPQFYKKVSEQPGKETQAWAEYAAAIIPSLILLFFGTLVLAPQLTRLLLGQDYTNAAQYVVWGAVIEMMRVLVNVYAMAAHAKKRTNLLIIPNFLGALTTLFLLHLLIPELGINGVGIALVGAGFLVNVSMHVILYQQMRIVIPYFQAGKALLVGVLIYLADHYCSRLIVLNDNLFFTLAHISVIAMLLLATEFLFLKTFADFRELSFNNE